MEETHRENWFTEKKEICFWNFKIKTERLISIYNLSQIYFAKSIIESTDDWWKSANRWTTDQKISQYCLSCVPNSNVKQPQDGSPQLHPGLRKHFWRGTWHCWHTGPHHGEGGWGFGSDSELLFARSQLPHWWLPLPRLALMQCVSSAAILQEAKHPDFLVMAVSDSVLAHVINPAHSHTTEGVILHQ